MSLSVRRQLRRRSVGLSFCHNFLKGREGATSINIGSCCQTTTYCWGIFFLENQLYQKRPLFLTLPLCSYLSNSFLNIRISKNISIDFISNLFSLANRIFIRILETTFQLIKSIYISIGNSILYILHIHKCINKIFSRPILQP